MKKVIYATIIFLLLATCAQAALTYGADNYKKNLQFVRTGSSNDPVYRFMTEVEAGLGGMDIGSGTIYYVDSAVDGSTGLSWATAVGTLQEGIDLCSANLGDFVYVAENHEENITAASALDADCEGITIVGFGEGENQPTISFITNAGAELTISEADITIYNMRFLGAYSGGITAGIYINGDGDGTRIIGCEFWETSSSMEQLIMLNVATDADALTIAGNRFIGGASSDPTSAIYFAGGSDKTIIQGNTFIGTWSASVVDILQATSTGVMITDNYVVNLDATAGKTLQVEASTNGAFINNACYANGAGFELVGAAMFVSPDNVAMQTEALPGRNIESMLGAFTGPVTGSAVDDNIKAALDHIGSDTDDILADTAAWDTSAEARTLLYGSDTAGATASAVSTVSGNVDSILVDTGTDIPSSISSIASSIAALSDTGYVGNNTAASQTAPVVALLAGFGDDYFNTGWSMICTLNYDSVGNAPEGEIRDITDYVSLTGTFTVETFSAALGSGDQVMVRRIEELNLDTPTILGGAGTIRYVDSGTSGDGSGLTWENAYSTLILAEAASSAGDVIYIADGHNEGWTQAAQPIIDVANLTIIGLGEGDARPLFDFDGNTTLVLTINAAGVTLKNLRFNPSASVMTKGIHFESGAIGCTMDNCAFITGEQSGDEWEDAILVDATAVVTINNCTYVNPNATAGEADTFINLEDTTIDNCTITNCRIFGTFADAAVYWGAAVPVNLTITNNIISNYTSAAMCVEGSGAATGVCSGNRLYANTYGSVLDPGSMMCFENYGSNAINTSAYLVPEVDDEVAEYGTGRIFYVDSGTPGAGDGRSWATAVATLGAAEALCTDDRGDTIYVAAGHAEGTLTTEYADIDVGGVTIIGLGNGDLRPTFTYTGGSATLSIDNDDITIKNLHFIAGADSVLVAITVKTGAENCRIEDCQFSFASATNEFDHCIDHAAANNNFVIKNCRFQMGANDAVAMVHFEDSDYAEIVGNEVHGDYSTACIHSDTTAADHIVIKHNTLFNGTIGGIAGLNTEPCIELLETTTGVISDNSLFCDVATPEASIVGADMFLARNTYSEIESTAGSRLIGDDQSLDVDIAGLVGKGTGQVWYVDRSGSGEDGRSWGSAFTTINLAEAACTADAGDIILVAEGHYEDVSNADAVDLDVAGISVIGMGVGNARPRIDFENAAAEVVISKANITIKNIQFRPGATNVLKAIDIEATGLNATIEDCAFLDGEETTVDEFVDGIIVHSTATGVTVRNCTYKTLNVTDGHVTTFVNLDQGACVDTTIENNVVYGDFSEAPIWGAAQVCLNLNIHNNILTNVNTGEHCIEFAGNATGMCTGNKMYADTWGSILDPGYMKCFENYAIDATDESGRLVPATSTVAGQTYTAVCTTSTAFAEDLFAVSAPIYILDFVGIVTTEIAAGPGNMKIWCDATTPAQDVDFSTAVATEGDAVGTKYVFSNATPSVLTPCEAAANGATSLFDSWFCPIGDIEQTNTDGDATGVIIWYLTWRCITDGTTVVAQ